MTAANEKIAEKVVDAVKESIEQMEIVIDIPWTKIAIAAGVSAGIGALTFTIAARIEDAMLRKAYQKALDENDDYTDISENQAPPIGSTEDCDGDIRYSLPTDLDNDPDILSDAGTTRILKDEEKEPYGRIIKENGYSNICPPIEIATEYEDFGNRADDYEQKTCLYLTKSDVVAWFDEDKEEFVELENESTNVAIEYLYESKDVDCIYVADHSEGIVYEVSVDNTNTFEEVKDDSSI